VVFAKVYHDVAKAQAVYEQMCELAALDGLAEAGLRVATPLAFVPMAAVVLQSPLAGQPLDAVITATVGNDRARRDEGERRVGQAATALAVLHGSGVSSPRLRAVETQVERLLGRAQRVEAIEPDLGAGMVTAASALADTLHLLDAWGARVTLVHGDCKPSQFLVDVDGIGLLDFDHCGRADPAGDVGDFIASLRQMAIRMSASRRGGDHRWLRNLEDCFLDTYVRAGSESGEDFGRRARWYQALALERKAYRAFQRSWRSPLPAALAAEARRCLSDSVWRGT
jgi:aminoglycoside phosphotransferase (APT) family kinase protein